MNDGDRKTVWGARLDAKAGEWIRFDWTTAQDIGGIVLYTPGPYLASFDVEVATAAGWERLARVASPDLARLRRIAVPLPARRTSSLRLANLARTADGVPAFNEVEIYPDRETIDRMNAEVDIAVSGDSRGNLIGTVSKDMGATGLSGVAVNIRGENWTRAATTAENGFFAVGIPLGVRGRVTVAAGGRELTVDAADLPLRLTARPRSGRLSLEGKWEILVDPPADRRQASGWKPIDVPSNWEMKGFRAASGTAVMRRTFDLPGSWQGKTIKLRAEAVYSRCEAWLNGVRVGSHDGGATPVEFDLTDAARFGRTNTLEVLIRARSRASEIDHMSVYAYFEIAGIWRPIEVFAVEPAHVSRVHWAVAFDKDYKNADLVVDATVANEQAAGVTNGRLGLRLVGPDGRVVKTETSNVSLGAWEEKAVPSTLHVEAPEPWTAERPRLYTLEASFNGATVETPVGFREMKVEGRRFTINGRGAKLFGVCLHAASPTDGRAISPALVEKDLELIKGCNLNAIRTSHYPPHPHTPEYADRVGLYIEDEGPACWSETDDLRDVPLYMGIYASFVERDRNHPSVVYWSMCNESN
ncbi:MAG TPA: glycoside hydrolase family 2 TIM barrel-domain containing protein, partial [Burkholderiales bacterium]|nr:glycoside hydrolase family 2 TIM barrel-domain containing protein [Burkholderiales bacterium]